MTATKASPPAGGSLTKERRRRIQESLAVNVRVARRELRHAAKRAHELMNAAEPGAAEAHLHLMAAIAETDAIGGEDV